ncbi:MAG: TetR/AcrR family transcriptional regulator [Lactobacillus sp.]|jgi:AcrR family transcriptional regulator|nr:TetR/AcrR family transcriptional regulator [Lactobacillus sp.]MCH3906570.1 TetR/AcrR family transcriptional regulator [Lactobacillus sp.]MCH3989794.1 TetR/AcrR family transcriptional regulator [Lactobacillus sp.]MCH4068040.1 TetR/AcrR family transcriptional regulator [Lactobacillus sp.]MCI1304004.1 TetR/AcrR family transcriptional regulator [Lactobacillus sp.]
MDIRIINTKNRIEKGLIKAMKETPLIQLRDKEVIAAAEVSSGTFYKYYNDKIDVLNNIENRLYDDFDQCLQKFTKNWTILKFSPNKSRIHGMIDRKAQDFLDYFNENSDILAVLLSSNGDPAVFHKMISMMSSAISKIMMYYYHIYKQEHTLFKKKFEFKLLSLQYSRDILYAFIVWIDNKDSFTTKDVKELIYQSIIFSPYDISKHYF